MFKWRSQLRSASFAVFAVAILVQFGCEQRIEEPRARSDGETPQTIASSAKRATSETGSSTGPSPDPVRPPCMKETPPNPVRTPLVGSAPNCPADNLDQPPELHKAKVTFESQAAPALTVEVAQRDADRQRGLMFRTEMAEDRGMIFVFEAMRHNRFWMRNTCISLDMLFIDDSGLIVGIEESTPTLTDQGFAVGCKSKYVLEVNGGFCRKHGIVAGQKVSLDGLP